jgi:hypothetical protein
LSSLFQISCPFSRDHRNHFSSQTACCSRRLSLSIPIYHSGRVRLLSLQWPTVSHMRVTRTQSQATRFTLPHRAMVRATVSSHTSSLYRHRCYFFYFPVAKPLSPHSIVTHSSGPCSHRVVQPPQGNHRTERRSTHVHRSLVADAALLWSSSLSLVSSPLSLSLLFLYTILHHASDAAMPPSLTVAVLPLAGGTPL